MVFKIILRRMAWWPSSSFTLASIYRRKNGRNRRIRNNSPGTLDRQFRYTAICCVLLSGPGARRSVTWWRADVAASKVIETMSDVIVFFVALLRRTAFSYIYCYRALQLAIHSKRSVYRSITHHIYNHSQIVNTVYRYSKKKDATCTNCMENQIY